MRAPRGGSFVFFIKVKKKQQKELRQFLMCVLCAALFETKQSF